MSLEAEVGYNFYQEITLDGRETMKSASNLRKGTKINL